MSGAMLKIAGMVAVFLSAWLASHSLSGRERAAVAQIEGYLSLFRVIRTGISYYRAPLSDILARCDEKILLSCCGREKVPRCESLTALADACCFYAEELEAIVRRAAHELGRSLGEGEVLMCDRCIDELTKLHRTRTIRMGEQTRLVGTLLWAGAAGIVIVLM